MPYKDIVKRRAADRKYKATHKDKLLQYRQSNKDKINKRGREWYQRNKHTEEYCNVKREWKMKNKNKVLSYVRTSHLRAMYGITVEQYDNMNKQQNGLCFLCGNPSCNRRLDIDHDHVSGKVRKLLCNKCNNGLGCFNDNTSLMEKAIQYIKDHKDYSNNNI